MSVAPSSVADRSCSPADTAAVAALVSDSSLPASSVKVTRTVMALLSSPDTTVYVGPSRWSAGCWLDTANIPAAQGYQGSLGGLQ